MTQLTEERFRDILAEQLAPLASKQDLAEGLRAVERRLMKHSEDLQAELARMVAQGFDELKQELDVRERVVKLESDMTRIKEALHV